MTCIYLLFVEMLNINKMAIIIVDMDGRLMHLKIMLIYKWKNQRLWPVIFECAHVPVLFKLCLYTV